MKTASPLQIVKKLFRGDIIPLLDADILREYAEVLHRPKFRFSEDHIATLLAVIAQYGVLLERLHTEVELVDPKDLVFYEVTMSARDENAYLITGNKKHFPVEPFIVSPSEMLEIMNKG